jgi:hypothetical protein
MMPDRLPLSTLGIVMPEEFNSVLYETIYSHVKTRQSDFPDPYRQFAGGWKALAYRFRSCAEHSRAFTKSIRQVGTAPVPEKRYLQEVELFYFFVSGLAAVESFSYALFAILTMLDSLTFPMVTAKNKRDISPTYMLGRLKNSRFSSEDITKALEEITSDSIYERWKEIRNVLAHRSSPGRIFNVGGDSETTLWKDFGIAINNTRTITEYEWLSKAINNLLEETNKFSKTSL